MKMSYERVDIKTLKFDKRNARKHDKKNIKAIKDSLLKFGQQKPIVVMKDGTVIAGNGTLQAAIELGWDTIDVHWTTLKKDEAIAYGLADNRSAELAAWDDSNLKELLTELSASGWDLEGLGWGDEDLGDILDKTNVDGLTDPDSLPDTEHNEFEVKLGDIWQLGEHRLMCGDSTDKETVEKLVEGFAPNIMITDPPYGVSYDAGWRAEAKGVKKTDRENVSKLSNDDIADWAKAYDLFRGNVCYVWHASAFTDVVIDGLKKVGFEIKAQIIWNKNVHALSRSDYQRKHEPCWYAVRKGQKHSWIGGRKQKTVWDISSVIFEKDAGGKTEHPTQKPVDIYIPSILNHTSEGDYLYDPFAGSGTQIIAAEKTGRRSLSMELDPNFCSVIIKRWQDFTGKQAVKL